MSQYVSVKSEGSLWTVGFYRPDGVFEPESDFASSEEAARRVRYLNGGSIDEERKIRISIDSLKKDLSPRSGLSLETFLHYSKEILQESQKILEAKSAYSDEDEALSAFYEDAALARILKIDAGRADHRALLAILVKVRRLRKLEGGVGSDLVDSALDSHLDIINYVLLHAGLLREAEEGRGGGRS